MAYRCRSDLSFEEYEREFKATGRLYSGLAFKKPRRPPNGKQLLTAYNAHIRKMKKIELKEAREKNETEESPDQALRSRCLIRDRGYCQAISVFDYAEYARFREKANVLEIKLDAAHVFGKNAFPHMRYLEDNVVMLNRLSHNWLDAGKSPVDGKPITKEEKAAWWKRIIGAERYEALKEISRGGNKE